MRLAGTERLLLGASRLTPSDAQEHTMRAVVAQGDVDWPRLVEEASWHRTASLVLNALQTVKLLDAIDPRVAEHLRGEHRETGARNLFVQAELERMVRALSTRDIDVVLLKGAALIATVYPDIALRPMRDVDLLVRPDDLIAATAVLAECGYAEEHAVPGATAQPRRALVGPRGWLAVDLHINLGPPEKALGFRVDDLWSRATPISIGKTTGLMPAPEDLLLHVALHFVRHQVDGSAGGLGRLADVCAIVDRTPTLDWDLLLQDTAAKGAGVPFALALLLAEELLDCPVPAGVRALDSDGVAQALVEPFVRHRLLPTKRWRRLEASSLRVDTWRGAMPARPGQVWRTASGPRRLPHVARHYARWMHTVGSVLAHPGEIARERRFGKAAAATVMRVPGAAATQPS